MVAEKPLWREQTLPKHRPVAKSALYDVVIIGGGITGLSAAYFLKQAGKTVCVLEREELGRVDTGHTTAHLTCVTDLRFTKLVSTFGEQAAELVWKAGVVAVDLIEQISAREKIACEFRRIPGYLHASIADVANEAKQFQHEAALANKFGIDAKFLAKVPFVNKPGIRFANQAKFHPLKYLAGLAKSISGDGSAIFEQSEVKKTTDDPRSVTANGVKIKCEHLVIATHVPLMGNTGLVKATLFQAKLFPYSSYVLGAKIPKGKIPAASFWDTSEPYYYLRVDAGKTSDYAIFGGDDHKTGQAASADERYGHLQAVLHELIPQAKIDRRWTGQVIETNDGLPYIGETAKHQFAATGFAGNGMTFGTLAGMMARDWVLQRENPWQELFAPSRKKLRGGTWNFVKENFDFPYYYVKDRLTPAEGNSVRDVQPGGGKVLKLNGQRVACSRSKDGKLTKVSAVCTHMGCLVHWNQPEETWDCPCHGSRFTATGQVIAGPAEAPLAPIRKAPAKKLSAKKQPAKKHAVKQSQGKYASAKKKTLPRF